MNKDDKISEILNFVTSHPSSTASLTIFRRHLNIENYYETGAELSIRVKKELLNHLNDEDSDEINFCYYLVK
jgi:hypothetical protein